jgi:triacylglycerol esterase/lipase EstA (alpha/beta hydrolase family)
MEKLASQVAVRQRFLKSPIAFVANIPLTYFNAMGTTFYNGIGRAFQRQINKTNSHQLIIANTVSLHLTIEQRAERMTEQVRKAYINNGKQRMHLVTHSFTGVDARAALSIFGMDEYVRSLTTLCSPHRGCALI